jgi:DNA repair exonuclease SbcCD ATPase subunit
MKFGTMTICNFLSVGSGEVNFDNRGLVLIEGRNDDDPSAKSNGAGKSTIVDALCYCLYGKTARGLTGDAVINRKAKKNCSVQVQVNSDDGNEYTIHRFRKSADGTGLTVAQGKTDLTRGTVAETQETIEEIIGCPYDVFVAAIYAGQEAMPDLPSMTDKQLKNLIESVIGVEKLNEAYKVVLQQRNELSVRHDAVRSGIERIEQNEEETLERIRSYEEDIKREEEEAKEREAEVEKRREKIKEEKDQISHRRKELDCERTNANAKIAAINKEIDKFSEHESRIREVENAVRKMDANARHLQMLADEAARQAKSKVEEAKKIDLKVGTKCSECGKVYTTEDLAEAKAIAVATAKNLIAEAKIKKSKAETASAEFASKSKELEELKASCDSSAMVSQRYTAMSELNKIENEERSLAWRLDKLNSELANLGKFSVRNSGYSERVKSEKENLLNIRNEKEKQQNIESSLYHSLEVYNQLAIVFGSGGVRAHILDTITPILNDRTARYLDVLSDGKLKAVWTTLSQTKKGELRESFNIAVENSVGGGSFASLSGGEKRKVRLACCLALQEVVASRATKPIELFIADEVDHALDEAGVERLIALLNEKAQTCGSLFVISHNPLRNWIDNVITVRKRDGISTIES